MSILLKLENVSAIYPGKQKPALSNVSLTLEKGGHMAILGPNGAGKSTLMTIMAGLFWTTAGSVFWRHAGNLENSRIVGQKETRLVSPARQESFQRQNWNRNGLALLLAAAEGAPFTQRGATDEADAISLLRSLESENLAEASISSMSQGQLRLLLLCRAILAKPSILLLDEFMDSLDAAKKKAATRHLAEISQHVTMVFATHREELLPVWINRKLKMRNGQLEAWRTDPPLAAFKIPGSKACPGQAPVCELNNVSVFIDRQKILHNIDWHVLKGELWHLQGVNGSGKSTLLRLMAGNEFAYADGKIQVWTSEGQPVANLSQWRRASSLISDLSQIRYDYDLKAWELVCTGLDGSVGLYRQYSPAEKNLALQWLDQFQTKNDEIDANASIRELSTGQLRRLFIARALINKPALLLLDEPCNGLDREGRHDFLQLLLKIASRGFSGWNPAIIFVSHYQEDIPAAFNHVATLEAGRLAVEK